jgi:ATP-dependent DNA helicase RecG
MNGAMHLLRAKVVLCCKCKEICLYLCCVLEASDELKVKVLFIRVRKTVGNMRPGHPWSSIDNIDMLKSAGMYLKDQNTGKQGITLAGILIFGSELMIQTALPHCRTDAILRRENLDRYDDRDDIRVNILR